MKARSIITLCLLAGFALLGLWGCGLVDAHTIANNLSLCAVGIVATKADTLQKRAAANDKANEILKRAKDDGDRDLTPEEDAEFNRLCDERDTLDVELKAIETRERRQQRAGAAPPASGNPPRGPEPRSEDRNNPVDNVPAEYSVMRAMRCVLAGRAVDGLEGEISQEIARRDNRSPQGFFVPYTMPIQQRALDTTTGAGALAHTVSTSVIEALRNRTIMGRLGATMMTGLVGTLDLPKQTAKNTAYWVGEATDVTGSNATIGQIEMAPSTLGGYTDLTRRFIKQTAIDAEAFARKELLSAIQLELDRVGLNGSGSGAEPEGILQNSDLPIVAIGTNGGAPTHAKVVALETTIAVANADSGSLSYCTSASGRGKLKTTEKGSAGFPIYLWGDDNTVNGYPVFASNQVPSNLTKGSGTDLTALLFGDFSTCVYGLWSGFDVLLDMITLAKSGGVRIITLIDAQFKIRQIERLAAIIDMTGGDVGA